MLTSEIITTKLKSLTLFLSVILFSISSVADTINMKCDLKLTTSNAWAAQANDTANEVWTYDKRVGLKSEHINYSLKECKLGDEELVCERYTQQKSDKDKSFYQKTYLNRFNLILKDYYEVEQGEGLFPSRMREGVCQVID